MGKDARNHLLQYLIVGYALLIVYASLYPLSGWQDRGDNPLGFLAATWPRYFTAFDLATNLIAYIPFGFLCASVPGARDRPFATCVLAALPGIALSLSMELAQNYLPSRIPSNLDLACNSVGALVGACAGTRWGRVFYGERHRALWRSHVATGTPGSDLGILLLAAWLMTQLSPETLVFGAGDVRHMLDLPPVQPFAADRFNHVEATIAAAGLLTAGLICQMLLRRRARTIALLLMACALLVKTFAHALIAGPSYSLAWLTPGAATGLTIGVMLLAAAGYLSAPLRRAMASLALLFATVMVNVAPENPYLHHAAFLWQSGQFLNFNGLTRLVCSLWPFLTLPWLMTYRPEPPNEIHR